MFTCLVYLGMIFMQNSHIILSLRKWIHLPGKFLNRTIEHTQCNYINNNMSERQRVEFGDVGNK